MSWAELDAALDQVETWIENHDRQALALILLGILFNVALFLWALRNP